MQSAAHATVNAVASLTPDQCCPPCCPCSLLLCPLLSHKLPCMLGKDYTVTLQAQNSPSHGSLAWVPATQLSVKELAASPSRRMDWSREAIIMGLNTFRSNCP